MRDESFTKPRSVHDEKDQENQSSTAEEGCDVMTSQTVDTAGWFERPIEDAINKESQSAVTEHSRTDSGELGSEAHPAAIVIVNLFFGAFVSSKLPIQDAP